MTLADITPPPRPGYFPKKISPGCRLTHTWESRAVSAGIEVGSSWSCCCHSGAPPSGRTAARCTRGWGASWAAPSAATATAAAATSQHCFISPSRIRTRSRELMKQYLFLEKYPPPLPLPKYLRRYQIYHLHSLYFLVILKLSFFIFVTII